MLTAVRQYVLKVMMKSRGETGIVKTLPKKDLVEFNVQITAEILARNGIDPVALKNANQVENAIKTIESRPTVQEGIRSTGSAKVFDMEGKEIPPGSKIMGGKEVENTTGSLMSVPNKKGLAGMEYDLPPPGSRGGPDDIAAPVQSSEETIKNMIEAENKKNIGKMRNRKMIEEAIDNVSPGFVKGDRKYNAQLVAEDLAEKKFNKDFYDLDNKQQTDIYGEALDGLDDSNNFAQGGRAGFKSGTSKILGLPAEEFKLEGDKGDQLDLALQMFLRDNEDNELLKIMLDKAEERGTSKLQVLMDLMKNQKVLDAIAEERGKIAMDKISVKDLARKEGSMKYGGRAGFRSGSGKGIMEFFQNMIKPRKPKVFDEKRFREGPIDLKFLDNLESKDLEKFIRTRDTGGRGGYGMYDNFADMPAGLRAAELISTIKGPANKINYKAAELFLGRKLRGDETVDELLQVLNRQEMRAEGGRIGYKDGPDMGRRTFLKILGGLAAVPIIGKFIKPLKTAKGVAKVPIIQTAPVKGKPEWFDALVNKVIIEGDDVTKKFATKEREIVHSKDLGGGTNVRVTQDLDEGAVRVEYDSPTNTFEDTVQMEYKKPLPDEGDPNPRAEFTTAESGPVGRGGRAPDGSDYEIDIDEVGGSSISDLDSDVSKLKEYATGKGPTMKEIVQIKKRKDKARAITEDPEAQSDAVIRKQGELQDYDYEDFASGGIARMLGE